MGKVYLKTRYDSEMNMLIPHSYNIANAMYGFRELGAEIVPYQKIDEIYDNVRREDIVLDYIDQCKSTFLKFGIVPDVPDYPDILKPIRGKAFVGKIISSISDLVGCGNCYENYEVLVSEPLDICAEWRCFITYDRIVDVRPYGVLLDPKRKSYMYHYDAKVLEAMLESFNKWEERPAACSMDICVTKDNKTLLVELNDAYSLGCYGLAGIYYAKLISARWSQLTGVKDEYRF